MPIFTRKDIISVNKALKAGWISSEGPEVKKFEKNFSKFIGCNYAIGCANGTDAITLALKSLNLPKNSEVIMPAMTYCSTAFAIINAGLKPVLVDLEKNKPTIDIKKLIDIINARFGSKISNN